jgi:hypothetical protein
MMPHHYPRHDVMLLLAEEEDVAAIMMWLEAGPSSTCQEHDDSQALEHTQCCDS